MTAWNRGRGRGRQIESLGFSAGAGAGVGVFSVSGWMRRMMISPLGRISGVAYCGMLPMNKSSADNSFARPSLASSSGDFSAANAGLPATATNVVQAPNDADHGCLVQERLAAKQQKHSTCCVLRRDERECKWQAWQQDWSQEPRPGKMRKPKSFRGNSERSQGCGTWLGKQKGAQPAKVERLF